MCGCEVLQLNLDHAVRRWSCEWRGRTGRSWPCEVTPGPHTSIMCSCDQRESAMSSQSGEQHWCGVCVGFFIYLLCTTVCKHLDFPQGNQYSCSCECVCMHVSTFTVSRQTNSWGEGMRERGKEERREGGKKTLLSTPAPWWQFAAAPLPLRGRLRLSYSGRGTAVRIVWGFLLIAPPLPPEGGLWSLHAFKYQRGKKYRGVVKLHSFTNAATGI